MVTANDGSPKTVMNVPLSAPSTAPSTRLIAMSAASEVTPECHSRPITVQVRPSMLATDRSISPVMTINVIGNAMSAIGMISRTTKRQNRGLATPSMNAAPITETSTTARMTTTSQERQLSHLGTFNLGTGPPPLEPVGHPDREGPVETDRQQDQRADGGPLPERVHPEHGQSGPDRGEQHRTEGGPVDRAAAAEDGHATNHDRGDDVELGVDAGVRVERAEPGRVERAGQAREGTARDEREEHAPADPKAGQPGRLRIRTDRVQIAPGPVGAQYEPGDDHNGHREQCEHRNALHRRRPHPQQPGRHVGRVDLLAAGPGVVDAPEHVQRAEGDHECRHPGGRDEPTVDRAAGRAEGGGHDDGDRDGQARGGQEQAAGGEGGQSQHRSDRQVDVAGDDDDRLPDRGDGEDRGPEQQVLDALRGQEAWVGHGRDPDQQHEGGEDAELPGQEPSPRRLRRGGGPTPLFHQGGHAWPVAANITDSSVAPARGRVATRRPSCMTRTRSAMPSTSGSSLETMSTATPCAARSASRWCTSALVLTSMPRVGSSTSSTRGAVASHFASTTFCWLPPESVETGSASALALTSRRRVHDWASRRSAPGQSRPSRVNAHNRARVALRSTDSSMTRPCCRRSSGTRATPAPIAAAGLCGVSGAPATRTVPRSYRSTPKTARITSLRPAPTRPANATISPARTWKLTSLNTPWLVRPSTASSTSPSVRSWRG